MCLCYLQVALSMPVGSAGQLCGRAEDSVGTCEGEDDTVRGGRGRGCLEALGRCVRRG